ncbi:hypothetical protein QA860_01350 [Streptomyces stelliscabiei]|nr:hypothetical protein [Streptomyces sp. 1222.2]
MGRAGYREARTTAARPTTTGHTPAHRTGLRQPETLHRHTEAGQHVP